MQMERYIAKKYQQKSAGLALNTEALARYTDVIDLSIGDTDFTTDQRIIDAAFADASRGFTHYGDPKGDPELIAAICKAWQEDFGQQITADEVLITTSSCMGMVQTVLGTLNAGDEVLVFGPYFALYRTQIEMAGARAVEVITTQQQGYQPQREAVEACISKKTRAMILNNPANPTGAAYTAETLQMLAEVAQEYDLLVFADEIYTRYLYDGQFIPMRTLPGMAERTVTLNSFSKNFLMTGWRVGCLIAHPALISVFQRVNDAMTYVAPSVSQRAALAALPLRRDLDQKYIAQYRKRVYDAYEQLRDISYLSVFRPQGTFYLFPNIAATGMDDYAFCDFLLDKAQVLVSAGRVFGAAGAGHIRIACTVADDRLREAMTRMKALEKYFQK